MGTAVSPLVKGAGRRSKVSDLATATSVVASGMSIALGGLWFHNRPCAAVRQLIRAGVSDLTLFSAPPSSYDVDLLIGAGAIKRGYLAHVSFEHLGLAPRFRAAAERGAFELIECDESTILGGLMATVEGLQHHPIVSLRGTDHLKTSPLAVADPAVSGEAPVAAPALRPDVAILHAQSADQFGNIRHNGAVFCDLLLAKASSHVIVTVDELVDNDEIRSDPGRTTIPAYLVDAVVPMAYGAHPCSSHGQYAQDEDHLHDYLKAASGSEVPAGPAFDRYLETFVKGPGDNHAEYLRRVGGLDRLNYSLQPTHASEDKS